jgi:hypothetical protein
MMSEALRKAAEQAIDTLGYYASVCGEDEQDTPAKQAQAALRAALGSTVKDCLTVQESEQSEPVAYQYRWTNPGNNPHAHPSETEWKLDELKHCKTIPEEAAQLARYRYDGKPIYEVRELYTHPPRREPLSDEQIGQLLFKYGYDADDKAMAAMIREAIHRITGEKT